MRIDRRELGAVFAGGFVGALARALLLDAYPFTVGQWPWPTFVANIAGAFLLGFVAVHLSEGRRPPTMPHLRHALVGTGFCGALTTFSTFQLELVRMLEQGSGGLAAGYATASLALGLLAAFSAAELADRVGTRLRG